MDVSPLTKVATAAADSKSEPSAGGTVCAQPSTSAKALPDLGRAAVLGDLQVQTRAHLKQALRLDPNATGPRILLFALSLQDGSLTEAEALVCALLEQNPDNADYLAMYAELKLRVLDLPGSRALTTRALGIAPAHLEAERVKVVLDILTAEPREPDLARSLDHTPDYEGVCLAIFHSLIDRHRFEEATRLGTALINVRPQEALNSALLDLRMLTHPLGLPLHALRTVGRLGSGALWLSAVAAYLTLASSSQSLATLLAITCGGLLLYSLVYPPLMRRWLRA
jgi:hypothetical protein